MLKYYQRTYYSLEDIADNLNLTGKGPFRMASTTSHRAVEMPTFINSVLTKANYDNLDMTTLINNTYLTEVWTKYIYPKFYNQFICYTDNKVCYEEPVVIEAGITFADFVGPIISWMQSSTEKFSLTIANYESNKSKLLGQIKSTSVNTFNDTPQNGGDFSDDNHTSTITTNSVSSDGGTLLFRLNEIEDSLKRLYEDWSNEFRKFIIWSAE